MNEKLETMRAISFGTELEYEGISRQRMADAILSVVGGRQTYGGPHSAITVVAPDGREWKAMSDGSLRDGAEFVTPILHWDDIELLQEVVRAIRHAGARTPETTSQHVHIGAADWTPQQITNMVRIFYKQERLILKAAGTLECRLNRYTRPTDRAFVSRILDRKPKTMRELNEAWFGEYRPTFPHYTPERYRTLNLCNLWDSKHTLEIRAFNGSTHAGEVKANIALCLMMAAKAKLAKAASARNQREYDETGAKFMMRVFLLHLGMVGEEFKNIRHHLLKRLPGSAAWRNGRPQA
jgi:hypothetical protein